MSTILALLPILALVVALSGLKLKAYQATLSAFAVGLIVALAAFSEHLAPAAIPMTVWGGVRFALVPICLVILSALFTYEATVLSGGMSTLRTKLAEITDDQRILALLVVFGFGNFMEGMAGFGTAVAIPAVILVGLGFKPLRAVLMCLVGNTAITPFGSVGVPTAALAKIADVDLTALTRTIYLLQIPVTAALPILILLVFGGRKALKGMGKTLLVAELAFFIPAFGAAWFLGQELPAILGGLSVLFALGYQATRGKESPNMKELASAALPFICVIVALGIMAVLPPSIKSRLTPGALILVAGFIGALIQGLKPLRLIKLVGETAGKYWSAFVTTCAVLALARVMESAHMTLTIAQSLVALTGGAYPFVSTVVGGLGGFLTGSGTSTCALFGALQADAARALSIDPLIVTASNVIGAGIGKMICPQSIALGIAAAGALGKESRVLKMSFKLFVVILSLACLTTGIAAKIFS